MPDRKKLIIDAEIPFIQGVFEPYADVRYIKGAEIDNAALEKTDGLLIRTRTQCTPALLKGSPLSFIGTATIGEDHIDTRYCEQMDIRIASAAGCNALAVAQYVLTAIIVLAQKQRKKIDGMTLGIVGVGNVGGCLAQMAQAIGMRVLLNDPPRALREGSAGFCSLNAVLTQSDVVSLHVPLQEDTLHLASVPFFEGLSRTPIFINTSRGRVVDEAALLRFAPKTSAVVLDVWDNEPQISKAVLDISSLATAHIAGYSVEGKQNATVAIVRAAAAFFDWKGLKKFTLSHLPMQRITLVSSLMTKEEALCTLFKNIFPILDEDLRLRMAPERFEAIRSSYVYRRENSGYVIDLQSIALSEACLESLGFHLK
jgi:Phosphoglycerate dehydrogenase and related dehydrogenases